MSKTVSFLDNPPKGGRRVKRKKGKTRAAKKGGARKKKAPPKGFKNWKAFMASIRPGGKKKAKKRTNSPTTKRAITVAKKRKSHAKRSNPPRKHHKARKSYRRRSNPPFGAIMKHARGTGPLAFAMQSTGRAVVGVGAEVTVRKVRGLLKMAPGTIKGSITEAALGLVGGYLLSLVHEGAGAAFAQGGLSAPLRTELQQLAIPHISDSLGDDGYLMGPGTGVTLISAFPEDYSGVVQGEDGDASLGRYVSGDVPSAMQGYVAGAINNAA
jgi:hypothetical protein